MSQENVETMRRSLDAFDRRDRNAWLVSRHPHVEVVPAGVWPEADVIRGPEAAWDFYVAALDAFEASTFADEVELVDSGADKVLLHYRQAVRGKTSGAKVEFVFWVVVTFREGKIVRDHWFVDQADALEAVRLRE
jgi:ketosteroid isomerase-like protein